MVEWIEILLLLLRGPRLLVSTLVVEWIEIPNREYPGRYWRVSTLVVEGIEIQILRLVHHLD